MLRFLTVSRLARNPYIYFEIACSLFAIFFMQLWGYVSIKPMGSLPFLSNIGPNDFLR
jgi:hypothetical protein